MHGRVKVKTTAEQEEERRKEREKKLEIYKAAICRVVEKRQNGELDDEVLQITAQVLQSNPDDSTLWNIRREVLGKLRGSGQVHFCWILRSVLAGVSRCYPANCTSGISASTATRSSRKHVRL